MQNFSNQHLQSALEISERKRLRLQRQNVLETFEPEDTGPWIMLDLMTLVLVFFIMLYTANASVPILPKIQSVINPDVSVEKASFSEVKKYDKRTIAQAHAKKAEKKLMTAMKGIDIDGYSVEFTDKRISLVIGEKISFPEGRADLIDDIKMPLKKVAQFINSEYVYRIIVSGHTDNIPIHTRKFPSNWELSVARALGVAKFLISQDVDPYLVSVEGFGPYNPIADNETREGRQANRRVEITLMKDPL